MDLRITKLMIVNMLLLSACSVHRNQTPIISKQSSGDSEQVRKVSVDSVNNQSKTENIATEQSSTQNSELIAIFREFDTEKPVSEITGTPPIKKESITATLSVLKSQLNNTHQITSNGTTSYSKSFDEYLRERYNVDSLVKVEVASINAEKKYAKLPYVVMIAIVVLFFFFHTYIHRLFQFLCKKLS